MGAGSEPTRREIHYGKRILRCFPDRPRSIDQVFRQAVARAPDRVALVCGERRPSYRELETEVATLAAGLSGLGLAPGERIALLLGNAIPFVTTVLAAARCGLIAVPMNIRQPRPEIEFVLNQCTAAALVFDAEHAARLPEASQVPDLRHRICVGEGPGLAFADLLAPRPAPDFAAVAEDSPFCLLYTSGTTGRPKGAILTHVGVIHSLIHFERAFSLTGEDVAMLAVPASHVTGLVAILLVMIRAAGTTVIMPAFKARIFLEQAAAERMSYTLMVPAMYTLCLLEPDFAGFDLAAWRIAGFGGAPMPEATSNRLAAALPDLRLSNCYGATETTSPATILPLGAFAAHPASVGRPVTCADIVVVDEHGREVGPGEAGELLIAGPNVVPGYWNNPEADAAGFVQGHWISGDIGAIDPDGFVRVFDRKKDMINRGGYKIYGIEVEGVLSLYPGVVECAVVGRPDPVLGERVEAYLYCAGATVDPEAIRAWCGERLSDYKVPERITVLDEPLPRNANGKVLKTALRRFDASPTAAPPG